MSVSPNGSSGLHITDLAKRYGPIVAVDDLDLSVPRGALIGFLGPNGAGKTTTMRAILGMDRPDRGTITWNGSPIDDDTRTRIGYMPQERGLYPRMKVRDQVRCFGDWPASRAPTPRRRPITGSRCTDSAIAPVRWSRSCQVATNSESSWPCRSSTTLTSSSSTNPSPASIRWPPRRCGRSSPSVPPAVRVSCSLRISSMSSKTSAKKS